MTKLEYSDRQLSTEELNRTLNFSQYEPVIDFENGEKWLGSKYVDIMRQVYQMPDTFGLCGVVALHAARILNRGGYLAKNINYIPEHMAQELRQVEQSEAGALRPYDRFTKEYPFDGKITTHAVTSEQDLNRIFERPGFRKGTAYTVAFLCTFPGNITYTHWLALEPINTRKVILIGDLSPFGLKHLLAIKTNILTVANALTRVIGYRPDINLSQKIENPSHKLPQNNPNSDTEGGYKFNLCTIDPNIYFDVHRGVHYTDFEATYYDIASNPRYYQ